MLIAKIKAFQKEYFWKAFSFSPCLLHYSIFLKSWLQTAHKMSFIQPNFVFYTI